MYELVEANGSPAEQADHLVSRFKYQAASWGHARRVVAKVEWHEGELYPRIGFIVTNMTGAAKQVTRFYKQRGTAE